MRVNITNENYVDQAEQAIINLSNKKDKKGKPLQMVTTSKIRGLLSMSADIYNQIVQNGNQELDVELQSRIDYLRVRFMYEAGRGDLVKNFIEETRILDVLKNAKKDKESYLLFSRYMEALVAFHRYYGGKDQ